jgi:ribose/xylose/arabinose/galactoside ABC-type transport system permease subunit
MISALDNSYGWAIIRCNVPLLIVYGMVLILAIGGANASERFLTDRNMNNVLRQASFLGIVALGQTLVILTGGIDLSVGSLVKLSVLVSAVLMDGNPDNVPKAILLTLGLGILVGASHAIVITQLNVAPFIVTLGSFSILRGAAFMISTGPVGRATRDFLRLYDQRFGNLPLIGEVPYPALCRSLSFSLSYCSWSSPSCCGAPRLGAISTPSAAMSKWPPCRASVFTGSSLALTSCAAPSPAWRA